MAIYCLFTKIRPELSIINNYSIMLFRRKMAEDKLMGAFNTLLFSRKRLFKIIKRFAILKIRLWPLLNRFFKNWNEEERNTNIPQPAFCNTDTDLSILRFLKSTFWVQDLNSLYTIT